MESALFDPESTPRGQKRRRSGPLRATAPKPNLAFFFTTLAVGGLGMGLVIGLPIVDGTLSELHLQGGVAMFIGSTTGLAGTYLALLMVVLASRTPALERILGQGGVMQWHKRLAPWPITLISLHAVFLTLAYAEVAKRGVLGEAAVIINTFPSMVTATVALGIMIAVGLVSVRQVRERVPRESWWLFHLLMYLALFLAFAHELALGPSFVGHPLARECWTVAWLLAASLVLVYRVGYPAYRSLRYRLRVVDVKQEGPGVVSVILQGRHLERLPIAGGQFFEWRFLTPQMWWQAHPFTVSALPQPPYLRLTAKGVGNFSRSLANVRVGTKVAIEGPYGSFTAFARRRNDVLLIAGGIGVTAIRSLLEDLPIKSRPVVVLRVSREEDLVLLDEIEKLVRHRKGVLHKLIGGRDVVELDEVPTLVPDIARRDVYISGPEGFVRQAADMARRAGVANEALHQEAYRI